MAQQILVCASSFESPAAAMTRSVAADNSSQVGRSVMKKAPPPPNVTEGSRTAVVKWSGRGLAEPHAFKMMIGMFVSDSAEPAFARVLKSRHQATIANAWPFGRSSLGSRDVYESV